MIKTLKKRGHSKEASEEINVVQEASMYQAKNSCLCKAGIVLVMLLILQRTSRGLLRSTSGRGRRDRERF